MELIWRDGDLSGYQGDARVLDEIPDASIDAIVTDPPYGLEFMGKEWDRLDARMTGGIQYGGRAEGTAAAERGASHTRGFADVDIPRMQGWHRDWAIEAMRVLKPGGHLVVFGGTRTHHRLWAAVEDAGFEVRDTLMWLYGSGFPKSMDVAKAFDKLTGTERAVVGYRDAGPDFRNNNFHRDSGERVIAAVTTPASDEAKRWAGWGTALKPAWEPILLARKPLSERNVVLNIRRWGVGALNVGATRISLHGASSTSEARRRSTFGGREGERAAESEAAGRINRRGSPEVYAADHGGESGRWPANLTLTHHEDCRYVESVLTRSDGHYPSMRGPSGDFSGATGGLNGQDDLVETYIEEAVERWACVPECPVRQLDMQTGKRGASAPVRGTEPSGVTNGIYGAFGGRTPGTFYADTGGASRFFYTGKAARSERDRGLDPRYWPKGNPHPTVKPLSLMCWLVRLVTPPDGTLLDPFMGSGTTLLAAREAGLRAIGVEIAGPLPLAGRPPAPPLDDYCTLAGERVLGWEVTNHRKTGEKKSQSY